MKDRMSTPHIMHYHDDYLLAGLGDMPVCAECLQAFQALVVELGVPLAEEKTKGLATWLAFLGIQLFTVRGTASLPVEKLWALKELLGDTPKKKCILREIQSVLGHLNFACQVVLPGWAFCARLAWAMAGVKAQHHRIQEYARTWRCGWNSYTTDRVGIWQMPMALEDTMQVNSDAAGSLGFGLRNGRWPGLRQASSKI